MIPEVGVEFVAECVSGYNLRYSHAMGSLFQARLRRLPEGTDMDDACTVPYFILDDLTWRETYQHEVGADQVVCEYLGEYLTPEQEAAQLVAELRDLYHVYTIEDAVKLRDGLNRYLEGQGVGEIAILKAIPDPALEGHPLPWHAYQNPDYPDEWNVDDARCDMVSGFIGQDLARYVAASANAASKLLAENARLAAENARLTQQVARLK